MSGDGGWAGIDQAVAAALSARGIPVVGLDSLRYYWTARTPSGVASDTDRMIRYYLAHFGKAARAADRLLAGRRRAAFCRQSAAGGDPRPCRSDRRHGNVRSTPCLNST